MNILTIPNTDKLKLAWKIVTDNIDFNYVPALKNYAKINNLDLHGFLKKTREDLCVEIGYLQRYGCNPFSLRDTEYKIALIDKELI